MSGDPNCIFCKIAAGTIPCTKLYEDGETLAFMDINPANDGHCLVIPKAHFPTVFALAPEAFAAAGRTVIKVASAVQAALTPDGINLLQANGSGAGQSVFHFHIHVLPRRHDDGLSINWTPKPGDRGRIAEIAVRIRQHL
ncbi:MAG TPA: HIT family protein [Stellaceae bacterium]|nr:HIT family protein [Stellaceae bacterium]